MSEKPSTDLRVDREVVRLRLGVVNADLAAISYAAGIDRAADVCEALAIEMDNDTYRKAAIAIREEKEA